MEKKIFGIGKQRVTWVILNVSHCKFVVGSKAIFAHSNIRHLCDQNNAMLIIDVIAQKKNNFFLELLKGNFYIERFIFIQSDRLNVQCTCKSNLSVCVTTVKTYCTCR